MAWCGVEGAKGAEGAEALEGAEGAECAPDGSASAPPPRAGRHTSPPSVPVDAAPVVGEPQRRRAFRFRGREGQTSTRSKLRKRFTYLTSLASGGKRDSNLEEAAHDAQQVWASVWEEISNDGDVGTDDQDALLACERWRRAAHGERHDVWFKLLAAFRHAEWQRLTTSIRSGVPSALRRPVWYACSGAATKRREAGIEYADFLAKGLVLEGTEASKTIEADLPRTGVQGAVLESLKNVLLAFSAKNTAIGYCQSMNFVTAAFLLYNTEEQAFWMLCSLIEDLLPAGYYTETMTGLRVDLRVLDSLVAQYLPDLHKHLADLDIDLSPITMNWFLCLFVNTLPADRSHRVMDCLLHEGSKVLFRTALSILRVREKELLNAPGVMDAYFLLRVPFGTDAPHSFEGIAPAASEELLEILYGPWLKGFSTDILVKLRREHGAAIQAEDEALEARRKEYLAQKAEAKQSAEELESPAQAAQRRRRHSNTLMPPPVPAGRNSFGFTGRASDPPAAAATWLSVVAGQEVDEASKDVGEYSNEEDDRRT